jgi:ubiquinone/menaquinone biosynthesis C-methylase UbiE
VKRRPVRLRATVLAIAVCTAAAFSVSFDRNANRETWQPPEKVLDAAGVREGMRIGEAGAGEGYLTFPLAKRVGDRGIVYANDISADDLETISDRAHREGVDNIVTVLGEIEDPLFPEKGLDMVIMVYVLHHLDRPVEFLQNLGPYLKSGAPLVIVEKNTEVERTHRYHFMTRGQIVETVEEAGFELERTDTSLSRDTIYICRVTRVSAATGNGSGSR